jgi:hypothetical protein
MVSKLQEMDAVIQHLYSSLIEDKDKDETLVVSVMDAEFFLIYWI